MQVREKSRSTVSKFLGVSAVALCAVAVSSPALAQSAGDSASQGGLDEIIVTARKVEENLQTVPVAVSAFSGETLKAQNAISVGDVARFTPGFLTVQGQNNPTVLEMSIRGQVQVDNLATLEPSVGTYMDGLYIGRAYGINGDLVDVSSVQVLKGPQGTLFGRNTSAGAVLIESNKPDVSGNSGQIDLTYGRFNAFTGSAVLNLAAVPDKFAVRGAIQYRKRSGYITDVNTGVKYNNLDNFTGRVKALFQASDDFSLLASGEWYSYKSRGPVRVMSYGGPNFGGVNVVGGYAGAVDAGYLTPAGAPPVPHNFAYYQALAASSPNLTGADTVPMTDTKTQTYSLTAKLDASFGTFKVIGGYRKIAATGIVDLDGTPYQILSTLGKQAIHQWSIEAQLTGTILDDKLDYAIGSTYFTEAGYDRSTSVNLRGAIPPGTPSLFGTIDNKSWGIYAQGTYHLTDQLAVTAGLRYSEDRKSLISRNTVLAGNALNLDNRTVIACTLATNLNGSINTWNGQPVSIANDGCALGHKDKFSSVSYTLGLNYQITPDVMVYAKTSRGYRSGGENLRAQGDISTFAPFKPEINNEQEIGLKSEFLDHKVRLNIAGYYNRINNAQRSSLLQVPGGSTLLTVLGNAQKVRNYGAEADLTVVVHPDITLQAAGNFNNSKYLKYTAPAAFGSSILADRSSSIFQAVPKSSFMLAANYEHDFGGVKITGRVDYSWVAKHYHATEANNVVLVGTTVLYLPSPQAEIDAFTTPSAGLLGARLGASFADDKYSIAIWGRNLTNNRDLVSSFNVAVFGLTSAVRREPATYGVTLGAKF